MAKQPGVATLTELKEKMELVFMPSPAMRATKAKFWKRCDYEEPRNVSVEMVVQITNSSSIRTWWSKEGFREWFLNKDEAAERLEYLYMLALDAAEDVLLNPNVPPSARIGLIKIVAQLAGKEPSKDQLFLDEEIQKMEPARLRALITKLAPKFLPPVPKPIPGEEFHQTGNSVSPNTSTNVEDDTSGTN